MGLITRLEFCFEQGFVDLRRRQRCAPRLEAREIEQHRVSELRSGDIAYAGKYRLDAAGEPFLPIAQHVFHGDALHMSVMDPNSPGLKVFNIHEKTTKNTGVSFREANTGKIPITAHLFFNLALRHAQSFVISADSAAQ